MMVDNKDLGRSPSGRAVAASPSSPQAVSPVPASIPSAVERLQALLIVCEAAGRHEQARIVLDICEALYGNDRVLCAFIADLIRVDAFLEAAHRMVRAPSVWRAYTDNTATVYGASPYNAAAQEAFNGFSEVRPLAICAGLLRMKLAPLLKAQAIEARRAETQSGSVHESAVRDSECAQPDGGSA